MLEESTVPNALDNSRPPAKLLPPRMLWQQLQLAVAVSSRPRLMSAVSKDCGSRRI